MLKLHELLLTFFYFGKAKVAPGTVGSFAAVVFWFLLSEYFSVSQISVTDQNIFWGIFLTFSFIYGSIFSPTYAKQFGEVDHGSIVLDEVVGQIIALQITFNFLPINYFEEIKIIAPHLILSFALFRYFDIQKPLFIGIADKKIKNGFGVMFDDLLSGIAAGAFILAAILIF